MNLLGKSSLPHFHFCLVTENSFPTNAVCWRGVVFEETKMVVKIGKKIAWENSQHLATLPLVSPPDGVWETSAEIPYWWHVITQIWIVLLIGHAAWEIWFNQSEALPRSGYWCIISMEFLRTLLRRHLAGKPVVASPNVGCFLRLGKRKICLNYQVIK